MQLFGYVRNLNKDNKPYTFDKPNLFYKEDDGEIYEYHVEIDDPCSELKEFLENSSLRFIAKDTEFMIISLSRLESKLDNEIMNYMRKAIGNPEKVDTSFCNQLNRIVDQCSQIYWLGGLNNSHLYLIFAFA